MADTLGTALAWWKSKTIWSAIIAALIVAWNTIGPHFGLPPIPELVYAVLAALGIYSRVTATRKIG